MNLSAFLTMGFKRSENTMQFFSLLCASCFVCHSHGVISKLGPDSCLLENWGE